MGTIASAALALGMIAAMVLAVGGARFIGRDRRRGLLMLIAAFVIFANVLIWTL